jgi:dTDP-4-dehydrorhamnose 3,5-epimerase
MEFQITELALKGLKLIEHGVAGDDRGSFSEVYRENVFSDAGLPTHFKQESQSHSVFGVLRGLHYQMDPHSQGKLIRCRAGEIFDVSVDLRVGSPTFGRWEGVVLSGADRQMLYIPPGFAHGFSVLSESVDFIYRQTEYYSPEDERGILWDDPDLGIKWPVKPISICDRDAGFPRLKDAEINFKYEDEEWVLPPLTSPFSFLEK